MGSTGTTDAVEVGVCRGRGREGVLLSDDRHVVVNNDVDTLNVDAAAENVGGDKDATLEVLELLVSRKAAIGNKAP
jgi:hypothetical protein